MTLQRLAILLVGTAACIGLSIYVATLGHPTAYWLWHDMLGVI
jgi:hypothetical protein